ncbi:hypothetical protein CONPUDRAFT_150828 [Coniophora puteana RWD-64-598 SS2]|uniref:Uncharacterized protein n=1 Tax=Coniophora puteana (strain RWD-64-598) TaxID=741705 RepID=A0A5M3MXN5_CONPW|nr:uncharacterized protein CONPUDRAFT_150828 [Coniophora puteana RWD-64-598 SS2]EIW83767.1 hypothetical protein CONPUDRAFT_150828 [Coniophora puteana RWD-64-598 SS2]
MDFNRLRCNTLPSSPSESHFTLPEAPYPAYHSTKTATTNRLRTNTLATPSHTHANAHGLPSPHSPTHGLANVPLKPAGRLLRLFAAGAVFETCTLSVPTHPAEGTTTTRAPGAQTTRGGSAAKILAYVVELGRVAVESGVLNREYGASGTGGQGGWMGGLRRKKRDKDDRPGTGSSGTGGGSGTAMPEGGFVSSGNANDAPGDIVEAMLIASLGGAEEGVVLRAAIERVGVHTRFCKVWDGLGVPKAWVLHAADSDSHTVINHNPLPDLSHEDFIALLGPILAPENYPSLSPNAHPNPHSHTINLNRSVAPPHPTHGHGGHRHTHGRGNSGDGWNPAIAPSPSPGTPAPFDWIHFEGRSVRTTLANMAGLDGLARERQWRHACAFSLDLGPGRAGVESLITHADIIFVTPLYPPLAAVLKPSTGAGPSAGQGDTKAHALSPRTLLLSLARSAPPHALLVAYCGRSRGAAALSVPTQEYYRSSELVKDTPPAKADEDKSKKGKEREKPSDETPAAMEDDPDAFIAGMIFALSRRVVPGPPFCPASSDSAMAPQLDDGPEKGQTQWNLSECLRFATEMAERAVRVRQSRGVSEWGGGFGVGREMARAGWFEGPELR